MIRRWRGFKDVPLSLNGEVRASLGLRKLSLDIIYHDHLVRCAETARRIEAPVLVEDPGPRPWNMGELFEGRPIDENTLGMARWYIIGNPYGTPPRGEPFATWSNRWESWIKSLRVGFAHAGVVTHNRNIQYLYAVQYGEFFYQMYDCDGPDFCTVHVYDQRTGAIAPWGGERTVHGYIYIIRHGDTEWGT
jgi:broad specificity phosphatase PhoE